MRFSAKSSPYGNGIVVESFFFSTLAVLFITEDQYIYFWSAGTRVEHFGVSVLGSTSEASYLGGLVASTSCTKSLGENLPLKNECILTSIFC